MAGGTMGTGINERRAHSRAHTDGPDGVAARSDETGHGRDRARLTDRRHGPRGGTHAAHGPRGPGHGTRRPATPVAVPVRVTTPWATVPSATARTSRRRAAGAARAVRRRRPPPRGRARGEPVGGAPALLEAASGYWDRRGLTTDPAHLAAASARAPSCSALTAALGGDVLVPSPLRRLVGAVRTAVGQTRLPRADTGRVRRCTGPARPLETVPPGPRRGRRPPPARAVRRRRPHRPPVAPPELLPRDHRGRRGRGLHLVSDETWRDTLHDPHDTVLLSPAEMPPERVTVVTDLAGAPAAAWLAGRRRPLPRQRRRQRPARACSTCSPRSAPGSRHPWPPRAAYALDRARAGSPHRRAAVGTPARACGRRRARRVVAAGATRPALRRRGRHLYADLRPAARRARRARVSATPRNWRTSSAPGSACPRPGGHTLRGRPAAPCAPARHRAPARCGTDERRTECLTSTDPLELPHATRVDRSEVGLRRSPRRLSDGSLLDDAAAPGRPRAPRVRRGPLGRGRRPPAARRAPGHRPSAGCGRGPSTTG